MLRWKREQNLLARKTIAFKALVEWEARKQAVRRVLGSLCFATQKAKQNNVPTYCSTYDFSVSFSSTTSTETHTRTHAAPCRLWGGGKQSAKWESFNIRLKVVGEHFGVELKGSSIKKKKKKSKEINLFDPEAVSHVPEIGCQRQTRCAMI